MVLQPLKYMKLARYPYVETRPARKILCILQLTCSFFFFASLAQNNNESSILIGGRGVDGGERTPNPRRDKFTRRRYMIRHII